MFNAISYTKDLKRAGFTEKQAEILMQCQIDVMNSHFATKEDISNLKGELKQDISNLRGELKQDISNFKGELNRFATKDDMGALDKKVDALKSNLNSEMKDLGYKLTIKLGGIMATGVLLNVAIVGLIFQANS